jgi:hypothetical protein
MDELEERLKRYRPVGPPLGLRARVVAPARTPARRLAWLPSVAAAAAAVVFHVLAASARHDLADEPGRAIHALRQLPVRWRLNLAETKRHGPWPPD